MTNEERDLITQFVQRVGGPPAAPPASTGLFGGGSVPATTAQAPTAPMDPEADGLLADLFARYPESRYRITQLAFVQEHALAAAQNRIAGLQAELQQARQMQAAAPPSSPQPAASPWGAAAQQAAQPSRGLFGGLFGGGQQSAPPPQYAPQPQQYAPQPQYAPGGSPGMFQRGGSGFLGSALTTAAGVAGGMVAGNALMGLFEGHHGEAAASGFGGGGAAQPWGAPASDPYNQGGMPKDDGVVDNTPWSTPDQGGQDTGNWQQADNSSGGWTDASDNSGGGDSGWTDDTNNS